MYASGGIMIQGNTFFQAPTPATVTGANEGTSLNGTNVVLGNDFGDPLQPALIDVDREIPYGPGVGLFFTFNNGEFTTITPTTMSGQNAAGSQTWQTSPGRITLVDNTGASVPKVDLQAVNNDVLIENNDGIVNIRSAPLNKELRVDLVNVRMILGTTGSVDNGASLQIPAEITTGDPGSGQGAWQLGTQIAAPSVFDPTNYVETTINGVLVKLACVQ
jgi:hypothetical protein